MEGAAGFNAKPDHRSTIAHLFAHSTRQIYVDLQAGEALCNSARSLPVPVVLEHVVRPLLLSLACGPDPALALVSIGCVLGGLLTARHLLQPLLAVLASSGAVRQSWTGKPWLMIMLKILRNYRCPAEASHPLSPN